MHAHTPHAILNSFKSALLMCWCADSVNLVGEILHIGDEHTLYPHWPLLLEIVGEILQSPVKRNHNYLDPGLMSYLVGGFNYNSYTINHTQSKRLELLAAYMLSSMQGWI